MVNRIVAVIPPTIAFPKRIDVRQASAYAYCYAGLRKKVKLEVPQLPDLGESSKEPSVTSRETERVICEWAETKLGIKFSSLSELSRHLSGASSRAPQGPSSTSPPPPLSQPHADEATSRQLMKQLKRKIQTQGTPGRPKKNKGQEVAGESPPSTSSYVPHLPTMPAVKHEGELPAELGYGYQPPYVYDARAPYPQYAAPPRAHPPPPPPAPHPSHPTHPHDYRPDPYVFEPPYAPRDLTLPPDTAHNLPINLSSSAGGSLDLSTERGDWQRRRPPEPPPPPPAAPARLPLPGKKLILETYQNETGGGSPRAPPERPPPPPALTEYLPKKMRAAEIMGGKLAAARHAYSAEAQSPSPSHPPPAPHPSHPPQTDTVRSEAAFLEDPKNLQSRSKSTAAALAREEQEAASPTRPVKGPTPRGERGRARRQPCAAGPSPEPASPDCCGLDGISMKTGMICEEKHSEILNRERVISICNIDKHDLDDYLNEGNSQEHEEELLKYFHQQREAAAAADAAAADNPSGADQQHAPFLETGLDPHDEHSQGKNEKLSQLRELLAKNLKNQSGSNAQNLPDSQVPQDTIQQTIPKADVSEGAFKPVAPNSIDTAKGQAIPNRHESNDKHPNTISNGNGPMMTYSNQNTANCITTNIGGPHLYNGNGHNEPQSPTTRTQQYDFVPISEGCHSPGNFNSKSPLGFCLRGNSPTKANNKAIIMGGSLQTSPISHSTAASPFVSPRNTPVPRSRLCPRPIPKHNNNRKRRTQLSLDPNCKQFAIPNDQKCMQKTPLNGPGLKYCQPMSAPPSPNIITYKNQMFHSGMTNGNSNMCLNFLPNAPFSREHMNGELTHPLSADPLSSEVSQFFQESMVSYRPGHDNSFRSQSVPLKQGMNLGLLSYANTPVGSVPPTPVPNEFCDFGSLADTCDISKAGLNPETLDKIYDAIDSSNDVLSTGPPNLLDSNSTLSNGCDPQPILMDEQLSSLIPTGGDQFNQSFAAENAAPDNVEDFLKRTNSIEFDLSDLVSEKNKYYTSRSVPSTPLPYKRTAPNLQIDSRRSRELFVADNYSNMSNGISSKSVPSTPQLAEERSVFSYSNRDFLINGNSVEVCGSNQLGGGVVDSETGLASPLHDMLREDILDPLTPAADLLADLDKIDGTPYVDL
ncbi:hypothetical protein NE865_12478 [Phthorimaea operculella]|nr:hypothetical protein NE865_12478 [Phthorimaea operculella]